MQGYGGNLSKVYLKANMLAGEAISNIRTIAAFCSEGKILELYGNELLEPSKFSFKRGQIAGLFFGISQFFIFSAYGLALWYKFSFFLSLLWCRIKSSTIYTQNPPYYFLHLHT